VRDPWRGGACTTTIEYRAQFAEEADVGTVTKMARKPADLKQRIAAAAAEILFRYGAKRLTQLEVAKALGIRQSHLTYYFPRRADLLAAVADAFLVHAATEFDAARGAPEAFLGELARRATAPGAFRAFLGLLIEADEDPALRDRLAEHLEQFSAVVARQLGRLPDDPDVQVLVFALRGLGFSCFLEREPASSELVLSIGRRLGLVPAVSPARRRTRSATTKHPKTGPAVPLLRARGRGRRKAGVNRSARAAS
jgi:AcrR family transcriptional regulator